MMLAIPPETITAPRRNTPTDVAAYLLLAIVYLIHLGYIWTYSVDIPYRDEWGALEPGGLPSGFSLHWLFGFWNEHRIVLTKLEMLCLYYLNGWNLTSQHLLNFLIYGLLVLLVIRLVQRATPDLPRWVPVCFGVFLLSPLAQENHLMGFQSQFHFTLLFFLIAIYALFAQRLSWLRLWAGIAAAILSIYSFASGVVFGATVMVAFATWLLVCAQPEPDARRTALLQGIAVCGTIVISLALWFNGHPRAPQGGAMVFPTSAAFWVYYLNLLSGGLAQSGLSLLPGFCFLVFALVPVIGIIGSRRSLLSAPMAASITVILGILAALSFMAVGRGAFGPEQAKASRYTEISMLLIPFSVAAWACFLEQRPRVCRMVLAAFWAMCCLAFLPTWTYFSQYQDQYVERMAGIECVKKYYVGIGKGNCEVLFPGNIATELDIAKRLDLSFYRSIRSGQL